MTRLTFRTKLLLAMMFIVGGVSVATLLVTQQRVEENYERMFRRQFERQIGYFTALQDARLGAVKDQCLKLSQSVRLIAAMGEHDVDAADLYQIAAGELREVMGGLAGEVRPGGPPPRRMRAAFFRFLDASGKPLSPPDNPADRALSLSFQRQLESKLVVVRDVLASGEPQPVGYLATTPDTNAASRVPAPMLQEVIITKVTDSETGRRLGALVLGFPLPDLAPLAAYSQTNSSAGPPGDELIHSGILLEGRLYANTNVVSEMTGRAVARLAGEHIAGGQSRQADFSCKLNGEEHRVFYELINTHSAFPAAYQVCLYPLAEARREQADLRLKILGSGAVALIMGLALSLFISHGLSAPIRELVTGTGEIQRGNFSVRVRVRSRDEIGQLAGSFNDMAVGLAQKEKYRTVLNMVADEKIAQQLLKGELTLGGELREISVLFCDIRGFTALTQNMPPGEVIEMLNEHMTALTRVVKEHHGVLDKFVGDLLMAIFGAPLAHGDDAFNAARCALELQRVRGELNRTSRHKIQVGIGLATGTVVAGCMGSTERMNYTVLGERVNLASRLCSQARAGEVLADEATIEKLAARIASEPTGEIQLKGFAAPVQAYRLCAVQKRTT